MKHIKQTIVGLLFLSTCFACSKPCDKSLALGEEVQISLSFVGFDLDKIENILVYRIDKSNPISIDTFKMADLLWEHTARASTDIITDRVPPNVSKTYGYYESYLNNCHLILDWGKKKDTLSDFDIKKSKKNVDGCHKNDPNVRIDRLMYVHKGKTIFKNESVLIIR